MVYRIKVRPTKLSF